MFKNYEKCFIFDCMIKQITYEIDNKGEIEFKDEANDFCYILEY